MFAVYQTCCPLRCPWTQFIGLIKVNKQKVARTKKENKKEIKALLIRSNWLYYADVINKGNSSIFLINGFLPLRIPIIIHLSISYRHAHKNYFN